MSALYADVIIDISHEKVDRVFQYKIPELLNGKLNIGDRVLVPFGRGNTLRSGYIVDIGSKPEYDTDKIKDINGIDTNSVSVESQLIQLAWWIKNRYGSTMSRALKTVLPVQTKVKQKENRRIFCMISREEISKRYEEAAKRKYTVQLRLLDIFETHDDILYDTAVKQFNISPSAIKSMADKGIIRIESELSYRNPISKIPVEGHTYKLNEQQQFIVNDLTHKFDRDELGVSLIHGITGSGKTEVYMELIQYMLDNKKQIIVLIPEIALTYQTVMRFYKRFGERVSIINSRLSAGERFDQFERARTGSADIMIGPRSALFTPFDRLGLIIIDEEHESAYKSEVVPRYHARETAIQRADISGAAVVLGSATPSVDTYSKALSGEYNLYKLDKRAKSESRPAFVEIVDLRNELKSGNKSIFSRRLKELIDDRLQKKEQIMLFLNRRGMANFVSCRSCGEAVKCPHCDVTMTLHRNNRLVCHYCGYTISLPDKCPSCGSPYIAGFGTGTQKIEDMLHTMYPAASVLRMDMDTTSKKKSHEEILAAFSEGRADILVGTQMIVKGHDFPRVTLVGILAADLSLYAPDYTSSERTYQLLTQAIGRAGRDSLPGTALIQTYKPEHYSIEAAARQDYNDFYRHEMAYRKLLKYPPVYQLMTIQLSSDNQDALNNYSDKVAAWFRGLDMLKSSVIIGPSEAPIYKVNDIYRKIIYIKNEKYDILINAKNKLENMPMLSSEGRYVSIQFDYL